MSLAGAIQGRSISITLPDGAAPGIQFEVPYIIFNLDAGHYVVGDPFIVDWERVDSSPPNPPHGKNPNPDGAPMPDPMLKTPTEWREQGNVSM